MSGQPISNSDLDWLAFRYAAGELSNDELNSFEELLATDERACLAVARAVQLAQTVAVCEQASNTEVRPAGLRRVNSEANPSPTRSLIAALTVALSLMFVVWVAQTPNVVPPPATASAVAELWINGANEEETPDTTVSDQDSDEATDEELVPAWLLAAVSEQQPRPDDKTTMQD